MARFGQMQSFVHDLLETISESGPSTQPSATRQPQKRALLIGVMYKGRNEIWSELPRAHRDCEQMHKLLSATYRYEEKSIKSLMDDGMHASPTKENILAEMKKLVHGLLPGDKLFLYFSGHGDQTACRPGDTTEPDGMDEALVPLDGTDQPSSWILDNELRSVLVRKVPIGAQLTAFFDMCHAGTALDLMHYCYNCGGRSTDTVMSRRSSRAGSDKHATSIQGRLFTAKRTSKDFVEIEDGKIIDQTLTGVTGERRLSLKTRQNTINLEYSPECSVPNSIKDGIDVAVQRSEASSPNFRKRRLARLVPRRTSGFLPSRPSSMPSLEQNASNPLRSASDGGEASSSPTVGALCCAPLPFRALTLSLRKSFTLRSKTAPGEEKIADVPSRASTGCSSVPLLSQRVSRPTARRSEPISLGGHSDGLVNENPLLFSIPRSASPDSFQRPTIENVLQQGQRYLPMGNMRKCSCDKRGQKESDGGQIISLASSKDNQMTWDQGTYGSLTSVLVAILENDPHPTYHKLTVAINKSLRELTDRARKYIDQRNLQKAQKSGNEVGETVDENFEILKKAVEEAGDGSIQTAILGSEHRINPRIETFEP